MPLYSCDLCSFYSKLKSDHKRHLQTKKHLRKIEEMSLISTNEHKMSTNEHKRAQKKYKCDYCDEIFTTIPNKRRHEIHYCKLNSVACTGQINKSSIKIIESKHDKEKKQLYKQIEKLIDKAGNTTIQNTQNTQNIKLNSYGKEDLSHITDIFKTKLLRGPYGMIPKMIEAVHFNDNKPENKNIQFTNKRDNKIKVFSKDKWIHKGKDETINDLMDGKYFILDTHYVKLLEDGTNIPDFYDKFRTLFDERDKLLMEDQKKECELVLINNR